MELKELSRRLRTLVMLNEKASKDENDTIFMEDLTREFEELCEDLLKSTLGPRDLMKTMVKSAVEGVVQVICEEEETKMEGLEKVMSNMLYVTLGVLSKGGVIKMSPTTNELIDKLRTALENMAKSIEGETGSDEIDEFLNSSKSNKEVIH